MQVLEQREPLVSSTTSSEMFENYQNAETHEKKSDSQEVTQR